MTFRYFARLLPRKILTRSGAVTAAIWLVSATLFVGDANAGDAVESSGDVLRLAIPAFAAVMTYRRDDKEGRRQFLKSFGANIAATWALKEVVDKQRPDGSDGGAFPSGHSSMAFQGAAFIHARYGIRAAWPAYTMAAYVAWTRVDADEHDVADVAAGAALGIAASMLLTRRFPDAGVSVAFERGAIGLRVKRRL
jgi:membrane-associated phospholipid phosphatase